MASPSGFPERATRWSSTKNGVNGPGTSSSRSRGSRSSRWPSPRGGEGGLQFLAAAGGLATAGAIYRASDLGGDVVYRYAGGIGTRSGDPADIDNLLVAGLYHAARNARESGRPETAARLIDELARTRPADTAVWLLATESQLRDRRDPGAAALALQGMVIPSRSRFAPRHGILRAEALVSLGQTDSARLVLQELRQRYPANQAVRDALARLP